MFRKPNTIINGEVAIKPYYYLRNGLLHVRFTVDRCVKLSPDEEVRIKAQLEGKPEQKQNILGKEWNLLTQFAGKAILNNGVMEGDKRTKEMTKEYKNGHKS